MRAKVAGWSVSDSDLIDCSAKGIVAVGVIVKETGDKYLAAIDAYYSDASKPVEVGKTVRISQRFLPMSEFRKRAGFVKI